MSVQVVSVRLDESDASSLAEQARQLHRTQGEAATLLLREKLREQQFPLIEFRTTAVGREAFVKGTRVKVWHVAVYAQRPENDAAQIAVLLSLPEARVRAALDYYAAFRDEVDAILAESDALTPEEVRRVLPNVQVVAPTGR